MASVCGGPIMDHQNGEVMCPKGRDLDDPPTCPDCEGRGWEYVATEYGAEKEFCMRCSGNGFVKVCDWCLGQSPN